MNCTDDGCEKWMPFQTGIHFCFKGWAVFVADKVVRDQAEYHEASLI